MNLFSDTVTCPRGRNGYCNWENNNDACNFDDGDCCLDHANCEHCIGNNCVCHETGRSHCGNQKKQSTFYPRASSSLGSKYYFVVVVVVLVLRKLPRGSK